MTGPALALINELLAARRISSVEAEVLCSSFSMPQSARWDSDESEDARRGLSLAIRAVATQRQIARALDTSPQAVSQRKVVLSRQVLDVERLTGVPRHVLRPDLYPRLKRAR